MKKLGLVLMCMLLATTLFAVDITVGGAVGLNGTFITGIEEDQGVTPDTGLRFGFEIGAFANFAINEMFSVQPELNFLLLREGYKEEDIDFFGSKIKFKSTITTKLLEIPILAKFNFDAGSGKLSPYLGPAIGLILGDIELDQEMFGISASGSAEPDNRVMFSAIVGVGYAMPMSNGNLLFDLRYRRAFTSAFDNDDERLNTISFRVGYGIGL